MPTAFFQSWYKDPEFVGLEPDHKVDIFLNFFDKQMADDEFYALPQDHQSEIRSNFLQQQGLSQTTDTTTTPVSPRIEEEPVIVRQPIVQPPRPSVPEKPLVPMRRDEEQPQIFGGGQARPGRGPDEGDSFAPDEEPKVPEKRSTASEILSLVPFTTLSALYGVTKPLLAPLEGTFADSNKLLKNAIEYWREKSTKGPDIPNFGVGFDEKGSIEFQSREPISSREMLGATAEGLGFIGGPVSVAGKAAGLVVPKIASKARPLYQHILKGMITGGLVGEGKEEETLENMALFGVFEPVAFAIGKISEVPRIIKESTPWRSMTIKERGLTLKSLDDMIQAGEFSEAEILRRWNNPTWRKDALERRMTEVVDDSQKAAGLARGERVGEEPGRPVPYEGGGAGEIEAGRVLQKARPEEGQIVFRVPPEAVKSPTIVAPVEPALPPTPEPVVETEGVEGAEEGEKKGKELWEMTKEEYAKWPEKELSEAYHRNAIVAALGEGKPIPKEVLADYPDLTPTAQPEKEAPGVGKEGKAKLEVEDNELTPEQFQQDMYQLQQSIPKYRARIDRLPQGRRTVELGMLGDAEKGLAELQNKWNEWGKQNPELAEGYRKRQEAIANVKVGDTVDVHHWGELEVTKVNQNTIRARRVSDDYPIQGLTISTRAITTISQIPPSLCTRNTGLTVSQTTREKNLYLF